MLRRARIRVDYLTLTKDRHPRVLFAFQIDAMERGVNVRDMFVRVFETKRHNFSLMTGLFARPYGYEVNLASAFRETPERGRMSQTLMPTERDLGAMVTFEPQDAKNKLHWLKVDAGLFNGQGLSSTTDFDSRKDFISRITIKPIKVDQFDISGGLSLLAGGWRQGSQYIYRAGHAPNGDKVFAVDSAISNVGKFAPRHYHGADLQVKLHHGWGETELRGEYWAGSQPGSASSTVNPGTLPTAPIFIRHFDGAFFYFLQHIGNSKHQLLLKYDWYDPSTHVQKTEIGKTGSNTGVADIRYATLGMGYIYHFTEKTKILLYYDIVKNEITQLSGYDRDLSDNVLTARLQLRF
jgi:hypothetical protein